MAKITRSQLVALLNSKVLTGGRQTTAQNVRDFENAIIESLINILDDKDVNEGYLGIDSNGRVNVSFIKSATPTNLFLRDDGTWAAVSGSGSQSLAQTLAIDNKTNEILLVSNNGQAKLYLQDNVSALEWNGTRYGVVSIDDNSVEIDHDLLINFGSPSVTKNGAEIAIYVEITYAALAGLITASTLKKEAKYKITDRADLGIIVDAVSENQLSYKASGIFLNADFQDVGDYSGVLALTGIAAGTRQGQWVTAETGYVDGDIVIRDCLHYQVIDQSQLNGSAPDVNPDAYTLLPKDIRYGYIMETDFLLYDFSADTYDRYDRLGNVVKNAGNTNWQWGRSGQLNNKVNCSGAFLDVLNNLGLFSNCTFDGEISVFDTGAANLGDIRNTRFHGHSSASITASFSSASFGLDNCVVETQQDITLEDKLHQNKTLTLNSSNFDCTLTTGISAGTFTIPTNRKSYVGKFIMNQTSTTISKIANTSTYFRTILEPANGKTMSFTITAVGSAVLNHIVGDATGTIALVGRANGDSDFIEIDVRTGDRNKRYNIVKIA